MVDEHQKVGLAVEVLGASLGSWLSDALAPVVPPGDDWTELLRRRDRHNGHEHQSYSPRDPALMLRVITERVVPRGVVPAWDVLPRQVHTHASELREFRNRWAHHAELAPGDGDRALDTAERLLTLLRLTEGAQRCRAARTVAADEARAGVGADPATPGDDATGSAPAADAPTGVRLELDTLDHVSLAMTLSQVPTVTRVRIHGVTADQAGCTLELEVRGLNGPVSQPTTRRLDLTAGVETVLTEVDVQLDPQVMVSIVQSERAEVRALLTAPDGATVATARRTVLLEAPQFWRARPLELGGEMLAAYVQPQSTIIGDLITEATPQLLERTGRSAWDGYQSQEPDRVDAMAAAIWDAMRRRDITYSNPPASWGLNGQRIRTPQEVLVDRVGTCLDTTVTLAAALEQVGINSTLWLYPGHILLSYWRTESSMPAPAVAEDGLGQNLIAVGGLRPLETTTVCGGEQSASFEAAVAAGQSTIDGDEALLILDLRAARESGIQPLPTRRDSTGTIEVITLPGRTDSQTGRTPPAAETAPSETSPTVRARHQAAATEQPQRVRDWKNALLDLSLRNRLINYSSRAGLNLAVPAGDLPRLEDLLHEEKAIDLAPSDELPRIYAARGIEHGRQLVDEERSALLRDKRRVFVDITSARYQTQLRSLANKARTIVQETGSNNLYLASGMLRWQLDGRELRSPLILTPVTLTSSSRGSRYRIELDQTGTSTPNYCLLEKLRTSLELELPALQEPESDDAGIDVAHVLQQVREALLTAGQPFTVEATAELAILQFARFALWRDLDQHWESFCSNSLVRHLVHTPTQDFADPTGVPEGTDLDQIAAQMPVPADASQLDAVAEAVHGRTFVLEGPPGTGKSQTITNLLAHALGQGRRVLFVAEKRAALDVVRQRLDAVGLGNFSLDLHDRDARPAVVRAQIRRALEHQVSDVSAEHARTEQTTAVSRRRLARYVGQVHDTNPAGYSLYSAHQHLLATAGEASLELRPEFVARVDPQTMGDLQELLRALPEHTDRARPGPDHPWGFLRRPPAPGTDLLQAAHRLDAAVAAVLAGPELSEASAALTSPEDARRWAAASALPRIDLRTLDIAARPAEQSRLQSLLAEVKELSATAPGWRATFAPDALELDAGDLRDRAVAADSSGFFGRKKRRRAVVATVAPQLAVPVEQVDLKEFSTRAAELAQSAEVVRRLRAGLSAVPAGPGLNPWNPVSAGAVVEQLRTLLQAADTIGSPAAEDSPLRRLYRATGQHTATGVLDELAGAWTSFETAAQIPETDLAAWLGADTFLDRWATTATGYRRRDGEELQSWTTLLQHVEPMRHPELQHLHADLLTGRLDPDEAARAFERGAAEASLAERLRAGNLEGADLRQQDAEIARFGRCSDELRALLPSVVPAAVVAQRTFDPTASAGQIGGLRRQLERQRGGMSVRALIEHYGPIISTLMPCVLTSPQSVSRYFPAGTAPFDLVVFDEASQIRVADAVGAMGRARSVVVVGDSKQMPPTSFAQVSVSTGEEELAVDQVLDEESILSECVSAAVPRKQLTWHYRSQDESLIAFSNHHYYDDRLSSFPAPQSDGAGLGVSLVRVDGHFDRSGKGAALRTNRIEAEALVADVRRRFDASPGRAPSLGLITFNAQQRDLIDNLLRDLGDDRITNALDEPDGLFVKNLENVQGDERDTIVFSIAFSRNDKGVLPLNFGPLNLAGGERRFNVAITRARRQVVLYASFDPAEIRETSAVGVRHLRAYLEMARAAEPVGSTYRTRTVDGHRDDLAAALTDRGLDVRTDVGLSDFRIDLTVASTTASPHRLAVMLDGDAWKRRRTVSDRDDLPARFLTRSMRWSKVLRVWLPRWLADRERVLDELEAAVHEAETTSPEHAEAPSAVHTTEPARQPATSQQSGAPHPTQHDGASSHSPADQLPGSTQRPEPDGRSADPNQPTPLRGAAPSAVPNRPEHVVAFQAWTPQRAGSTRVLDALPAGTASAKVHAVLVEGIRSEGPIHQERLAKAAAGAFGLGRVVGNRTASILQHVPPALTTTEQVFVWPAEIDPISWLGVRTSETTERPVEHISLVELANGLRVSAQELGGAAEDELARQALALFGGRRVTAGIRARMSEAVELGLATGRLTRSGFGLAAATPGSQR